MGKFVLNMNLQTFDEVDWDAFEAEFEKEFSEPTPDTDPNPTPEPEPNPAPEPEPDKKDGEPTPTPEPDKKDGDAKPPVQTPEANKAFQELRRQAEARKPFEDFVADLAAKAGMTPDQYIQAVKDKQLEEEAKAKGKDPELYKETAQLKDRLTAIESRDADEKFNNHVELARIKLGITPDQVMETLQKAYAQGVNPRLLPFEAVHKLVNPVDPAEIEKQAVQKYLEEQKKKQDSYVPNSNSATTNTDSSNIDDEVANFLREKGDIT